MRHLPSQEELTGRLLRGTARALAALPPRAQVRLSGRPAVHLDGETLAPEIQLMLALLERREPPLQEVLPDAARLTRRRAAAVFPVPTPALGAVSELQLETDLPLRARHYAPAERGGPHPLLVFFHGGGWVFGDLDTHDGVCRLLCAHVGAHVLAIDYRLAPEHPFPAAVEDARAALEWALANATQLDADSRRIGVGGDSAGGNLAAVASQLAAGDGGPAPVLQLLIYPATDFTTKRRSRELFGEGFFLTEEHMKWFEQHYLGVAGAGSSDPRASPLLAENLSGLAPALVFTAAFDPLRDEGEAYAEALRAAGTPAMVRRFPGLIHGFVSAAGVSPLCHDALLEIAGATRATFAAASAPSAASSTAEPLLARRSP